MGRFFRLLWWIDTHVSKGFVPRAYEKGYGYSAGSIVGVLMEGILIGPWSWILDLFECHYVKELWRQQAERDRQKLKEIENSGEDKIGWG